MKTFATLAATALVMFGTLGAPQAQARGGGAIAAGVIGGLAAGALLGAAISDAHAAPGYGYGDGGGYGGPGYGYGYDYPPPPPPPPPRRVRAYEYDAAPVYRSERIVCSYEEEPEYGYRRVGYGGHRHCDRPYGYGGW
ncbi:hypothetical protein [Methylobacterium sp. J-076]|uniref:hypothetical protein n=1 Tax=Methylobacterium sp. J-076 TaxID=2836655 RepID=UPI001FB8C714|nr:hypothetical protein [Methylobacterium sp. J-076]MCJ2014529.1 hypothetical protein [Methylobacterium sp. J-076]